MGLFPHYHADPAAAETAGNTAKDQQATFSALKDNLSGQSDNASQQASGVVKLPVQGTTQPSQNGSQTAGQAALVAGGATTHFAKAIQTYNDHIDDLNQEWEQAKARDFGVGAEEGHEEGNSDAENREARNGLIADARSDKKQALEEKRKGYEADLDDAADFAASMLILGPCEETILSLVATGDIDLQPAADALGTTVQALDKFRGSVATAATVATWKEMFPAMVRGDWARLEKALKPGNLFGKYAYLPKHRAGGVPRALRAFSKLGKVAGRALPPLAVLSGGWGVIDTLRNWEGSFDNWNDVVGSGAMVVGGGIATAAMLGVAISPVGWVVAGVAGVVAVGSLVVKYREEIWNGIKWAGGKAWDGMKWVGDKTWDGLKWAGSEIADTAGDVKDWATDTAGDVKDWAGETAGDVKDWATDTAGDVKDWATDTAGDVADTATDVVDDVGDTVSDGLDKAGEALDSITPW